ncbi:hypothetical protein [Bdellovibrio sp. KM01]|uniref:hypothetical protein n=1 Tax=Bdellovibrio sp. KM01 TaxID=2748865 RepID=UPI0015E95DA5|nr:hypothetical protein [Bdellovibrio sp. KM01]QLY23869.1 hypothetical protein HW988_10225 [Bdellovibrio sp. KM01]
MNIGFWMTALVLSSSVATTVAHAQTVEIKWAGSEHLSLGESGAFAACRQLGISKTDCPVTDLPRGDKKISFRYGEILMSADFYNSPDEFYSDRRKGIKHVIKCTHDEIHGDKPKTCNNIATFFSMPKYLGVVTKNYNHFGWYNMKDYVKYHQQAIDKALKSYALKDSNPEKSLLLYQQAMIANAYADHYLTDAFASGHVRVPRVQVVEWAKANLEGFLKKNRGDLITMLLHDNESKNLKTGVEEAFPVSNAYGDEWETRGDGHLQIDENPLDPVRLHPEHAVRESVKEVLVAALYGVEPKGIFSATWMVPFSQDIPFYQKFTAAHQQMTEMDFVNSFFRKQPLIKATHVARYDLGRCLKAMPDIFAEFRKAVRKDIQTTPELSRRLPARYLEAFSNVN